MITMEKLGRLRRLYFRDGLTLSEIARKTGFARYTVKTWPRATEGVEPKYRRRAGQIKISPFTALLRHVTLTSFDYCGRTLRPTHRRRHRVGKRQLHLS